MFWAKVWWEKFWWNVGSGDLVGIFNRAFGGVVGKCRDFCEVENGGEFEILMMGEIEQLCGFCSAGSVYLVKIYPVTV